MKILLTLSLMSLLIALQGCSSESFKRGTFETLQNYNRQQCLNDPAADCPERESYDDYQRQRKEAQRDQ
jgi:hypothetical protein